MTALAALSVIALFALAAETATRLHRADALVRRLVMRTAADRAVESAIRRGIPVNPAPPRRWSQDRKPEPVHKVLHDMPQSR